MSATPLRAPSLLSGAEEEGGAGEGVDGPRERFPAMGRGAGLGAVRASGHSAGRATLRGKLRPSDPYGPVRALPVPD